MTLWLSALNVRYRDVQYTLPFLSQAWFFATPVAYSALVFPANLRIWIGVNPMAGVVQGFRWAIIGNQAGQVGHLMLLSFGVVLVLLVGGLEYSAGWRGASPMSSEALVLRAEGLGKSYRIGEREPYKALRDVLTDALTAPVRRARHAANETGPTDRIWALSTSRSTSGRGRSWG